jgi:hypothetical protein
VRRHWIDVGVTAGVIAGAATAGALIGFGVRFGTPLRPFNTVAAAVLGQFAFGAASPPAFVTLVGIVLHFAIALAWGVAYVYAVGRSRGYRWQWGLAAGVAMFFLTSLFARALGIGLGTLLPLGDRIVLALVLALALPVGMGFALRASRIE